LDVVTAARNLVFDGQRFGEQQATRAQDALFDLAHGERSGGGELGCELMRLGHQLALRHDLVQQLDAQGLGGAERVADPLLAARRGRA
jgi:hypothetical protein